MVMLLHILCVRDCDQEVNVTTHFMCDRINKECGKMSMILHMLCVRDFDMHNVNILYVIK